MKNSKFIFVPMLATSVFIFTPDITHAEDGNTNEGNIVQESTNSLTIETNTYEDKSSHESEETSVKETSQNTFSQPEKKNINEVNIESTTSEKEQTPNFDDQNADKIEEPVERIDSSDTPQKNDSNEVSEVQTGEKNKSGGNTTVQIEEDEISVENQQPATNTVENNNTNVTDNSSESEAPIEEDQTTDETHQQTIETPETKDTKVTGDSSESEAPSEAPIEEIQTADESQQQTIETPETKDTKADDDTLESETSLEKDVQNEDEFSSQKNDQEADSPKTDTDSSPVANNDLMDTSEINKSAESYIGDHKKSIKDKETATEDNSNDASLTTKNEDVTESKSDVEEEDELNANETTTTSLSATSKESLSEDEVENNNDEIDNDTVKEIQTMKLNDDTSIKLYSFDTKAKSSEPVVSNVQYAARFTDGNHSGLYSPVTTTEGVSLDFMDDKTVFITQKAKYNGTTYYRVHQDLNGAMQGWVKEKDLRLFNISETINHTRDYAINKSGQHLLTNPWGTSEQQKAALDDYDTKLFRAEEKLTLGSLTFYYGKINKDYGWLQDTKLKEATPPKITNVDYAARLDTNKNSGLYSPVTSRQSHSYDFMKNKTIFISQKSDYNGSVFYRVHSSLEGAMQGWINENDLDKWRIFGPDAHKKQYSVIDKNDYLLSDPYGTDKQTIKKFSTYGDSNFKAEKKLKIGALTYYYGKIGTDYGWVSDSKIKPATPKISKAEFAVRVANSNNSGIFSPVTSEKGHTLGKLEDMTLYTTQRAVYDGVTYYLVHSDIDGAMQGWIKENDLDKWRIFGPDAHKKQYSVIDKNDYLLETPYGTSLQRVSKLNKYGNVAFQSQKSIKIGAITFYYGKIGNDYGWIQENRLKDYRPVAPSPSPTVKTVKYNQSFNQVLNIQMNLRSKPQAWANGGGWRNATRSEVARFLDTSHQTSETWMYTFLDLDRSQNIATSTINNKLLSGKGILNNQGSAFLDASKTHGINEVYLISHALHETGNGTSTLARGVRLDSNGNVSSNGKKYYNMYGIAAYDHNPVIAGARYAQQMGWDTPAKAIVGGARFISQSYFNRGQTTLYSMRWNPANPGTYQYATDVNWAYATAQNLRNYYRQLGIRGRYYTKHIF